MDNREFPMTRLENMNPKLYEAATKGDMKVLTSIVGVDSPPDLTLCLTPQNNTALHIAVEFRCQNIVEKVIQMCPSLISQRNSKGDTPLHVAARAGHLDITKLLTSALNLNLMEGNPALEEGNRVQQNPLRMRNLEGNNPIEEALKKSHREVALKKSHGEVALKSHGEVALHLLAFDERHELARGLAFDERHELARGLNGAGESLLYLAAEAGLENVVRRIIDGGDYSADGPDGQNPLHIAVIKCQLGVVKILRDKSNFIRQADRFGNTVLHYASAQSYQRVPEVEDEYPRCCRINNRPFQVQILEHLLKANSSLAYVPNIKGDYPLFIAIRNNFCRAVDIILNHCPDSAELVNQKGQNALHLAVMQKNRHTRCHLTRRWAFQRLINEPDNDGNTPMHLATLTNQEEMAKLLIKIGPPDLTMSNKEGRTAMDTCRDTETEHPIRNRLIKSGAVPGRHRWLELLPIPSLPKYRIKKVAISPEFKKLGLQTLPIVTSLVATVTFAAAFTVPGGYKNDGPREGLPVFMRNAALHAFVLSDILAFCSSMAATVLLVYANARSDNAFKVNYALKACYVISGVAILATTTAFLTAVYVLTSKESLWLAVTSLSLGSAVTLFLGCYIGFLKQKERNLRLKDNVRYLFKDV